MVQTLDLNAFLEAPGVTLDVRSPSEFMHAPVPGAFSFPLFSDEERAQVGTCYKQVNREAAVELGLRLVGPRFADMVVHARELCMGQTAKVYCWRGGMRSASVAWLLETAGLKALTLQGGYKAYRLKTLDTLTSLGKAPHLVVLSGMTGSGKTEILKSLAAIGEQVLDLEALASHRGSSYGAIGLPSQPSEEHFENEIARIWRDFDRRRPIWLEDESRQIGKVRVPTDLFQAMMKAETIVINRPRAERVAILLEQYGGMERTALVEATQRLSRRLGDERMREAVGALAAGHLSECIHLVLDYYDATYTHALGRRGCKPVVVEAEGLSADELAARLRRDF